MTVIRRRKPVDTEKEVVRRFKDVFYEKGHWRVIHYEELACGHRLNATELKRMKLTRICKRCREQQLGTGTDDLETAP